MNKAILPLRYSLILLLAPLAGCVTTEELSCDMHEARTRQLKPLTTYKYVKLNPGQAAPRTLPVGSLPQAPTYTMKFVPGFTKPCTTITLHKDVMLLKSNDRGTVLNETREFYADDGTLITTTTQNISEQVPRSGVYIATTPLPIPRNAPPGKYKIVSKLQAERRGDRRPTQIAHTEGYFYIIPPK